MKKCNLVLGALAGINLGLILSSYNDAAAEQMSPKMQTFYEQLDPAAQQKFDQLDDTHKKRAMGIVDQYCKAVKECKGHREESVDKQYQLQMQEKRAKLQKQ